jgi:hypothetical protein
MVNRRHPVDVCLSSNNAEQLVRSEGLGGGHRSHRVYISQLLTPEKACPAQIGQTSTRRWRISQSVEREADELARLSAGCVEEGYRPAGADVSEVRELVPHAGRQQQIRAIFEKQPFGELERPSHKNFWT